MAELPGPPWWSRCGLWRLSWPSLWLIETCLAGCNKQNEMRQQKCLNVYESTKWFPKKRSHLEKTEKHLTSSSLLWKKKKIPIWGQFTFEIHIHLKWLEGRKGGKGQKERREGGREQRLVQSLEHEEFLTTLVTYLSSLKITLFSHKIEQMQTWGLIFYQVRSPLKCLLSFGKYPK